MLKFGYTGIWEILIIALCVFWLLNAYRKSRILRKIDEQLDSKPTNQNPSNRHISDFPDAEDVDYEEVK